MSIAALIKRYNSETIIIFADQAFVSFTNFFTGILLARFLGLEGYGIFVLVYGIILFISGIQLSLIILPMMVKIPLLTQKEQQETAGILFYKQFVFCFLVCVFVTLLGILISEIFPQWDVGPVIKPLIGSSACFLMQDFFRRYFFTVNRPKDAIINDFCSYGLKLLLLIVFFTSLGSFTVVVALWIMAVTSLIAVFLGCCQIGWSNLARFPDINLLIVSSKEYWDFGKWLLATNIVNWGGTQLVNYLSAAVLSLAAVGAMSACKNIVGIVNIMFLALQNMLSSRASVQYRDKGNIGLRKYLIRISIAGGGTTFCIMLVASIWSELWIGLLYGTLYSGFGWIVIWWALYNFVGFFHRPLSAGLRVLKMTRSVFLSYFAGALIVLIFGYPALIYAEINGAMLMLCIVQMVILLSLSLNFFNATKVSLHKITKSDSCSILERR